MMQSFLRNRTRFTWEEVDHDSDTETIDDELLWSHASAKTPAPKNEVDENEKKHLDDIFWMIEALPAHKRSNLFSHLATKATTIDVEECDATPWDELKQMVLGHYAGLTDYELYMEKRKFQRKNIVNSSVMEWSATPQPVTKVDDFEPILNDFYGDSIYAADL